MVSIAQNIIEEMEVKCEKVVLEEDSRSYYVRVVPLF